MSTTTLRVAELDFDTIKSNLQSYMASQPEFTDYDFNGSGLSVIMDLLAYNTHYNAVIGNMLVQEMYLDTAVKPESIALIAKRLGYVPQSARSPSATISIEVFPTGTPPTSLTLGKNAQFSANVDSNTTVTFITRDAYTITPVNGRYIFPNVVLYEGSSSTFSYVVDTTTLQKYEIPSSAVDTTLLRLTVQDNISSTNIVEWTGYNTLIDLTPTTLAYFTKVNENANYEVYFGDGVFGQPIANGNVITLDYVSTNGPLANGVSTFTFNDSIGGFSDFTISTISAAAGGAFAESVDSVRSNAQNAVYAQNRAITEADYAALIGQYIPVESVSVWGGETLTPPVYGKVFISINQPGTTTPLNDVQKATVLTDIQSRSPLGLLQEIVDPEYMYLTINTNVLYNPNSTTLGPYTLSTNITNALVSWGTSNLNTFNSKFVYSALVSYIDSIDPSIIGNDTNITFTKTLPLVYNVNSSYVFNFYCSIKQSNSIDTNITSTGFISSDNINQTVYLADSNGILYTYYIYNSAKTILNSNVGTVDYINGIITLSATAVPGSALNSLSVTVTPDNKNTIKSRNNIITLNTSNINVTLSTV